MTSRSTTVLVELPSLFAGLAIPVRMRHRCQARKGSSAYRSRRRQRQCKGNSECRKRKLAFCPWQNKLGCERRFHSRRRHRADSQRAVRGTIGVMSMAAPYARPSPKLFRTKNRYPYRQLSRCRRGSARRNLHDAGRNIRSDKKSLWPKAPTQRLRERKLQRPLQYLTNKEQKQ